MELTFDAEIENGAIRLPDDVQSHVADSTKVHVTLHVDSKDSDEDMIEYLLNHPIEVEAFTPMTREEIHDRSKH